MEGGRLLVLAPKANAAPAATTAATQGTHRHPRHLRPAGLAASPLAAPGAGGPPRPPSRAPARGITVWAKAVWAKGTACSAGGWVGPTGGRAGSAGGWVGPTAGVATPARGLGTARPLSTRLADPAVELGSVHLTGDIGVHAPVRGDQERGRQDGQAVGDRSLGVVDRGPVGVPGSQELPQLGRVGGVISDSEDHGVAPAGVLVGELHQLGQLLCA